MKTSVIISAIALGLAVSTAAMAQTGQPIPPPVGAHVVANTPAAMETPTTMKGGLYRLGNGYLSCPQAIPMTGGQPNLRSCTYEKDLH